MPIVVGLLLAAACSYLASRTEDFTTLITLRVIEGAGYISVVLAALALLVHTTEAIAAPPRWRSGR